FPPLEEIPLLEEALQSEEIVPPAASDTWSLDVEDDPAGLDPEAELPEVDSLPDFWSQEMGPEVSGDADEPPPLAPAARKVDEDDLLEPELVEMTENPEVEPVWVSRIARYSVDELSRKLARVEDREEIADVLMDYLRSRFDHSALFILRGGAAYGWKGAAGETEIPGFKQFRLPLDSPSVLQAVANREEVQVGKMPETVSNGLLREALGGTEPGLALALPLAATGTTVGIVYVDRGTGGIEEELPALRKVLAKAGLAFEILISREKILMS
ncbi:MAG: hypothetical protein IH614_18435, partial [Desulfuromonadales bacterium]|nr:hypothetical protein [Desulfuromonadales bacterium]